MAELEDLSTATFEWTVGAWLKDLPLLCSGSLRFLCLGLSCCWFRSSVNLHLEVSSLLLLFQFKIITIAEISSHIIFKLSNCAL